LLYHCLYKNLAASPRWKGSEKFDKFPSASCIERLARRFGENATAMSGPCQGKALANCVCSQLEGLGIYTDGLAAKVANTIHNQDPYINSPMKSCVAMLVREGYDVNDSCVVCDGLRAAYAEPEELLIEAIAQFNPALAKPRRGNLARVDNDSAGDADNKDMSQPMEMPKPLDD